MGRFALQEETVGYRIQVIAVRSTSSSINLPVEEESVTRVAVIINTDTRHGGGGLVEEAG